MGRIKWSVCIGLLFLAILSLRGFAEDKPNVFNADVEYDVYYEAAKSQVYCAQSVKIGGLKNIEGVSFLVVKGNYSLKEREGYILFSSIKAILPTGYVRVIKNATPSVTHQE